jgi:hypothetical protein
MSEKVADCSQDIDIIQGLKKRFSYLSVDVSEFIASDHPSKQFSDENYFSPEEANLFTESLEKQATQWADSIATQNPEEDVDLKIAIDGLMKSLRAITATSVMVSYMGRVLVERPGIEMPGRSKEITKFIQDVLSNPRSASFADRLALAKLCLLGLGKMPFETINYANVNDISIILGKMVSRLSQKKNMGDNPINFLKSFSVYESEILNEHRLSRVGLPVGTRPRIYVPESFISLDVQTYESSRIELSAGDTPEKAMVNLLSLMWRDFCDEAFIALHKGSAIKAFALVAGCCYSYEGKVVEKDGKIEVVNENLPSLISSAGVFIPMPWRRAPNSVSYEGGTKNLQDFREKIMTLEQVSEQEREESGGQGFFLKAAKQLLARQINYNMTRVFNERMGRIAIPEWSPNMSRDSNDVIYNPAHAMGGVGDMFRGPLFYGDALSQVRSWRERDGTHKFDDVRKFIAYSHAVDEYFENNPSLEI